MPIPTFLIRTKRDAVDGIITMYHGGLQYQASTRLRMKLYEEQLIRTVVDRVCDVCGSSVMIEVNGQKYEEVGELKAHWGCGSKADGTVYHLDLCEDCFRYAVSSLRELRRSTIMFDKDQEFPTKDFGIDKSRTS